MTDTTDSSQSTIPMTEPPDPDTGGPIRVLIVDDGPEVADLAAASLERRDDRFAVDTEADADAGLAALDATAYDCVVSDYDMAGFDGIEFLSAVRERDPDLPFILYTGKGSEEVASEAISAGVTDYVQKRSGGSQFDVLANRIRNAVDRYRARRALESNRERLALFFEQSPLGVIEWDEEYRCVRVNAAATEILGYEADELVGRPWHVIVPEPDREAIEQVVSDLLADEGGYHHVNDNVRKDGDRITCEWHNRVVTDDDGSVVTIFSQFQDVTDRRRQARRMETLISNLPGIVYHGRNDRGWPMEQVWGEVEGLTGYARSDPWADGLYGHEIVHPDDQDYVWEAVQDALRDGDSFELTYRIVTRSGAVRWVWERGRRIEAVNEDGAVIEGFITDVTDRATPPSDAAG